MLLITSKPFYLITAHLQDCQNNPEQCLWRGWGELSGLGQRLLGIAEPTAFQSTREICVSAMPTDRLPLAADTKFCPWQPEI